MDEKISLEGSFLLAPVPVVLVACAHEELGRNLLTIAWCGVDCSEPPIVHVSIRPSRYSHRMIKESGCFTVNIPTVNMLHAVDLCGTVSGREGDKFERAGLTPIGAAEVPAPLVAECPVNIECILKKKIPLGTHPLFIGEIIQVHIDQDILNNEGKIDFTKAAPLTYGAVKKGEGEYWSLKKKIGKHGYSHSHE